ncbi:MAG: hypothetical protein K9I82_02450 [Chitinophagaceae bacterium]|nr:hypothetical protein [Chitinophagaceae bacterium]
MTTTKQFKKVGLNIKPENWAYAGNYIYFRYPDGEDGYEVESELDADFKLMGVTNEVEWTNNFLSQEEHKCSCCNHRIKRGMFFVEKEDVQDVIYVGFDCGKNILQYTFDVNGAKKQTMIQRKKRLTQIKISSVLDSNKDLENLLSVNHPIIRNIATSFYQTGNISEKQIDFIGKLAISRKELEAVATEFVEGKVKDVFKVLSCKKYVDDFTNSVKYKVLIENLKGHWKAYGNISTLVEVGTEITASGTFIKSDNDPLFGYFKRLRIVG